MRSPTAVLGLGVYCALFLSACSLWRGKAAEPVQLATSLQQLVPHADRDHFVYVWQRTVDGKPVGDGIQVEHVSALGTAGEFEIILSENGMAAGRVRVRDDGHALLLVSEDDLTRGLRLAYDPPLPQLEVPLSSGERRATATATVSRLVDGQPVGSMEVTQLIEASPAPPVHTILVTAEHPVRLRLVRTLQTPDGLIELSTTMALVPGLGEVESEGRATNAPTLYRELACATIGGRQFGDCHNLNARVEEMKSARPTHVQ